MRAGQMRSWAWTLLATVSVGFTSPALGAEGLPAKRVPLRVSAAVRAEAGAAAGVQEPDAAEAPATDTKSPRSFWKSPQGIVAGVLLAGGLAWVFYSKSHDRVKSPANR